MLLLLYAGELGSA